MRQQLEEFPVNTLNVSGKPFPMLRRDDVRECGFSTSRFTPNVVLLVCREWVTQCISPNTLPNVAFYIRKCILDVFQPTTMLLCVGNPRLVLLMVRYLNALQLIVSLFRFPTS